MILPRAPSRGLSKGGVLEFSAVLGSTIGSRQSDPKTPTLAKGVQSLYILYGLSLDILYTPAREACGG